MAVRLGSRRRTRVDGAGLAPPVPAAVSVPATGLRPSVALITEGTYPCGGGGVSVWCDQLVHGLPEVDFRLVAIVLNHQDRPIWKLPPNVRSVEMFPLWDRSLDRLRSGASMLEPPPALRRLVRLICDPPHDDDDLDVSAFGEAIRALAIELASPAFAGGLTFVSVSQLFSEEVLASDYLRTVFTPTLGDCLHLAEIFSHILRPLTIDVGEVDVVHTSANGLCSLVALSALARRGTPFMLTEHGLYLRERYIGLDDELASPLLKHVVMRFYRLLCMVSYRLATLVAPASDFNRRWELALGAPPERVRTLYNGIDPEQFAGVTEAVAPSVTWLGRIDPIKDLSTLIKSAALVRDRVPDVRFRLFGDAPAGHRAYLMSLRREIEELNLGGVVCFEGRVSEPAEAFHSGQVAALSSISEGFPYVVLEAMASGLPVVATDVGGVSEAIGSTGYVVPAKDHDAMARSICHLLAHPDRRRAMGAAARERVRTRFTLSTMLTTHLELYRNWARTPAAAVVDLREWVAARPPASRRFVEVLS